MSTASIQYLINIRLSIEGKCEREDIVFLMVRTPIIKHCLRGYPLPVRTGGGLDERGHSFTVQTLCLTEVNYVEYHSLYNNVCEKCVHIYKMIVNKLYVLLLYTEQVYWG